MKVRRSAPMGENHANRTERRGRKCNPVAVNIQNAGRNLFPASVAGVSYPALKGGASCLTAPPCLLFFNPREGRGGIGRSSTGTADGTHPALLKRTREAFRSRSKAKPQWGQ